MHGPVTFVTLRRPERHARLAIIDARPAETIEDLLAKDADNLAEPVRGRRQATTVTSVARLLSTLFVRRDTSRRSCWCSPARTLLVAERERWPEGRYLAVDLQLVCERNDDKQGRRGRPGPDLPVAPSRWLPTPRATSGGRATLAESVKHTVGVSKDLREGVRLSIEIIANEVVARRAAQGLEPLPAGGGAAAGQAVAALPLPDPLPALRRGVARAGRAADRRAGVRARLQPRPAARADPGRADHASSPQAGTHLYESLGVLFRLVDQGHDAGAAEQDADGEYVDGLTFRSPARRPLQARGHRAHRRGRPRQRARCRRCCGTCC